MAANWSGKGSEAAEGKIKGDGANHPESLSAHRVSPAHGSEPNVQMKGVKSLSAFRKTWCKPKGGFDLAELCPSHELP